MFWLQGVQSGAKVNPVASLLIFVNYFYRKNVSKILVMIHILIHIEISHWTLWVNRLCSSIANLEDHRPTNPETNYVICFGQLVPMGSLISDYFIISLLKGYGLATLLWGHLY